MKTILILPVLRQAAAIAAAIVSVVLLPRPAEAQFTFTNLHSFSVFPNGADPVAPLVEGSDGIFYGTTYGGGTNGGNGTVFKVTTNGVLTTLYEFTGGVDGGNPRGGLVQGSDGNFYGTTENGGSNYAGNIFQITTNGTLTSLHAFTYNDGSHPFAALALGTDGNFYGTTSQGGTNGLGNIFKITAGGLLTSLHSFNTNRDGVNPLAPLVQGTDGNFYGTTSQGGTNGFGTVFQITTGGTLTHLHSFTNLTDGDTPSAALVQGSDGSFYGTTSRGGSNDLGTVFKVTASGSLTHLHSFTKVAAKNGLEPFGALVQGADGTLYGTTLEGGTNFQGTIFKITTNGILTSLYSFTGSGDGGNPRAALVQASDGILYGTASAGGAGFAGGGNGTVFKISTNGMLFATVYAFPGVNDGQNAAALMHGSDGNFYGTSQTGGTNGANGNVFRLSPGGTLASLYSFTGGSDGQNPQAALVENSAGGFYGTTFQGGTNDYGTVFETTTNGVLNTLYTFAGDYDAGYPEAALVQGGDGNYYGTTFSGGTVGYNNGSVFRISPSGVLTTLYLFTGGNDGANPNGLVLGNDGDFYGTTYGGGTNNYGTVFKITTSGTLTSLHSFTGTNDGGRPLTALVLGGDGNFYGTTSEGGTNYANYGYGTIFEMTLNGSLTTLFSCAGDTNGDSPSALLAGTDGNFYGTTSDGGTNYSGSVFELTSAGVLTNLYSFTGGPDGGSPATSLVQGSDGSLYGTTTYGAAGGYGGVFRVGGSSLPSPLPRITLQPASPPLTLAGLSATFTVDALGGAPLSYQWLLNGVPLSSDGDFSGANLAILTVDPASLDDAGTYSVVVSNSYGVTASSTAVLSLYAPTNTAEDFTAGTNQLAEGDFLAATLSFSNALNLSPANATYYFFYAASQLLSAPQDPAGSNFLNRLGYSEAGRDIYHWTALLAHKAPLGVNADEFTSQLRTNVLATIIAAQANLAAITATNFTVALTTNETHTAAVTVDWGDVQLLRSLCDTAELIIYTTYSWNLNAQLTDVSNILATTDHSYQALLADYPNGLTTTSTADLPLAKGAFTNAINEYFAASQFIRNRPAGEIRLFNLDTNRLTEEFHFRETLTNLLASLTGPAVTLTANTNYAVSAAAFFSGSFDARAFLPQFQGGEFVWGTFPDPTFGGIIDGLTEVSAGKIILKRFETMLDVPGISISTLYDFTSYFEQNGVVQGLDGSLYGTGTYAGTNGIGAVFKITQTGQFSYLYSFGSVEFDGYFPNALVLGTDGNFYGTTQAGGANGRGAFFKITPSGALTTLYSFSTETDSYADIPDAALVQGADGRFYGTTLGGGTDQSGTVFAVTTNGVITTLHSFTNSSDGGGPSAPLVRGVDGNFYGTASYAGDWGYGTIFKITPSGNLTSLYSFGSVRDALGDPLDGANPNGLIQGADGNFYGTTPSGGTNDDYIGEFGIDNLGGYGVGDGTVFRISSTGSLSFTNLLSFDQKFLDGYGPFGSLVPAANGAFYGVVSAGGVNKAGALFVLTTNYTATNVFWLGQLSGDYGNDFYSYNYNSYTYTPMPAPLTLGRDGNYYGTTTDGGRYGNGTVYVLSGGKQSVSFVTSPGGIFYTNGQLHLEVTGLTGQGSVVIEASTNLIQWQPIFTNPPATGTIEFTDPTATSHRFRYYRAVIP